ncbi:MAG: HAMP domain-containing protein [Ignavibacteriae bacterium]|nr:HAMP domain-containing protein [Ignavibacteria bacterium]MBI3363831.1 HAMP domain-containing protein [Ignavibacteriota bacterium]
MKSIRTKTTLSYAVLAILLVAGISVLSTLKIESYFKDRLVDDLSHQADLIFLFLSSDSSLSFQEINDRVKAVSGIEKLRITLIDADGKVIADSDVPVDRLSSVENHLHRPEVQQALTQPIGVDTRHSVTVGRDFLYVAKAVISNPKNGFSRAARFIRLSVPLEDVQSRTSEIRFTILTVGVIAFILITIVSVFISRHVTRSMVQIARSVERIRTGNLDEHIPITSDDEVGQVARAVNELVDKLKSDIVQLKRLERVRSEFLGNVSHELRTPIFALQGFLETLLNGAVNDPTVNRSFLEKAQVNATRLNALLTDLINISQIESGEMLMSFRFFRINDFLRAIEQDFVQAAKQKQVTLVFDAQCGESTEVYGDRERLRQVMDNLIDNAIKYNTPEGEVLVTSVEKNGTVEIGVKDTGVGIAPEHMSRIFERFYRVDKDRSREVGGTGLGLAIVKHIVEAHESSVDAQSSPGKGSIFRFTLRKG